ncbi:hypothetical protein [Actinoplanes couchii]
MAQLSELLDQQGTGSGPSRRSRSWAVMGCLVLTAVVAIAAAVWHSSEGDYVDHLYRVHRVALGELAEDYRSGKLPAEPDLPADLRTLCPSGFAYANDTVLFVQVWENWRSESGIGLGYFTQPPTGRPRVTTADGDYGYPVREVGDGWWWVA